MNNFTQILDKPKNIALLKLREFVLSSIKKEISDFNNDLSDLHNFVQKKDVNDLRLSLFNLINSKIEWENLILDICGDDLKYKHGSDLLVQSKINLSIQMPNDETSVLPIHTDSSSADSPFQSNIWIPLTDAFDTNSMYVLDKEQTLQFVNNSVKKKLKEFHSSNFNIKKENFINVKFGQILLFNPSILHGNMLNETNKTRVSLNLRVKSMFSPEPDLRNADRKFGTYYKILTITDETKFSLDFIKSGYLQ